MGTCNGCGWCCQFDGIQRNVLIPLSGRRTVDGSDRRFYELRGGVADAAGSVVRYTTYLFCPCSAHDAVSKRCVDYDGRPQACRDFPQTPEQVEGTPCSYWFEDDSGTGGIVRRGGTGSPFPTPPRFER